MEIISLAIILVVGFIAGFFGTLIGGGSLITIPMFIFLGLPPDIAIATNRLGVTGAPLFSIPNFHKQGLIDYKLALIIAVPGLIGSIIGANLLFEVSNEVLRYVVAIVTLLILGLMIYKPKLGIEKHVQKITRKKYIIGLILAFFIGIYQGFYGAGAGTFLTYLLILFFGQTFLQSAGTRKIPLLITSLAATILFVLKGVIVYSFGIALIIGTGLGSYLSSYYSKQIGNEWIRKMFIGIVLIMVVKLIIG